MPILFGNLMRDQAEYFTSEEAEHLLDAACAAFPVVVADIGSYWDNAATICTLRKADTRIVMHDRSIVPFSGGWRPLDPPSVPVVWNTARSISTSSHTHAMENRRVQGERDQ